VSSAEGSDDIRFRDALAGLQRGDFSRLAPMFEKSGSTRPLIVQWYEQGRFSNHPQESAEALTCACFLGLTDVAEYLLTQGLAPSGGMGTGLNAFHWAANRGQIAAVRLLIRHQAPLETRNMYGGTVLGGTVWAAVHETKPSHPFILEELLNAGANLGEADYPTGDTRVDNLLRRFGAG
jgi:hypothetical protein